MIKNFNSSYSLKFKEDYLLLLEKEELRSERIQTIIEIRHKKLNDIFLTKRKTKEIERENKLNCQNNPQINTKDIKIPNNFQLAVYDYYSNVFCL